MAIGPQLSGGRRLILLGNDNDYSVTQTGAGEQFDVYVDFAGHFARCVLDPTQCEVNPAATDIVIEQPGGTSRRLLAPAGHAPCVSRVDDRPRGLRGTS